MKVNAGKRKHIKSILAQYPDMKPSEVARWANCNPELVYQVRWELKKVAQDKAPTVPTTAHTSIKVQPTVSIAEACEILQRAVTSVDNLDVTVLPTVVQFDYQGSIYAAPPAEAKVILDAIKTLKTYAV